MKAVCMVAHPDDCVIFAYSLMHNFPALNWHVSYLTYHAADERAQEFQHFWHQRGITTAFLGFVDDYRDLERDHVSIDLNLARDAVHAELHDADVVLTHDAHGDYGHPHHRFVHRCVQLLCHDHVITFAAPGTGTHHYEITDPDYDVKQLPNHYNIVRSFHVDKHCNSYCMSPTTYHRIMNA